MMKDKEFKPFDKVLVRQAEDQEWMIDLFAYYEKNDDYNYHCLCSYWKYCIPYEGNENLLGTKDSPKSKKWRALVGDIYYLIADELEVATSYEKWHSVDDKRWQIGNYFKTREEAKEVAEKFKKLLKDGM